MPAARSAIGWSSGRPATAMIASSSPAGRGSREQATAQDGVERQRRLAVGAIAGVPRQLLDQERVALGLGHDPRGVAGRVGAAAEVDERQVERVAVEHRPDLDVLGLDRGQRDLLVELAQERVRVAALAAERDDQQERGRVGRAHQRREQRHAVGIAPLQVVDREHQRLAIGDAREQLAQRRERAPPQLHRIGRGDRAPAAAP